MLGLAFLIAVFIAAVIISSNGPTEKWPHPEPGKDNPYQNWKE